MEIDNGKEYDNMEEKMKTVIQIEEFDEKESRRYNVSVLIKPSSGFRKDDIECC